MAQSSSTTPVLRYRDPGEAAQWLSEAFGFRVERIERDEDGLPAIATLIAGEGSVLLCRTEGSVFDTLMVQPGDVGVRDTQTCYITVDDVDEHCQRAYEAGADIQVLPEDDGTGRRFYICRDPEGHLWSFGDRAFSQVTPAARQPSNSFLQRAAVPVLAAGALMGGWLLYANANVDTRGGAPGASLAEQQERLKAVTAEEKLRRVSAEQAAAYAEKLRSDAENAAITLKQQLLGARKALKRAKRERQAAMLSLGALRVQSSRERALDKELSATTQNKLAGELKQVRRRLAFATTNLKLKDRAINEKNRTIAGLDKELITKDRRLQNKQQELGAAAKRYDRLDAKTSRLSAKAARLEGAVRKAEAAAAVASRRLQKADAANKRLQSKLAAAERKVQDTETLLKAHQARKEKRLAFVSADMRKLTIALDAERSRTAKANQTLQKVRLQLKHTRARAAKLDTEVNALRKQLDRREKSLARLHATPKLKSRRLVRRRARVKNRKRRGTRAIQASSRRATNSRRARTQRTATRSNSRRITSTSRSGQVRSQRVARNPSVAGAGSGVIRHPISGRVFRGKPAASAASKPTQPGAVFTGRAVKGALFDCDATPHCKD